MAITLTPADSEGMESVQSAAEALVASATDPTTRLLEAVVELTSAEGGIAELAPILVELACSVANAGGASILMVESAEIVSIACTGLLSGTEGNRNSREHSLSGLVVATGVAQVAVDTLTDTRVDREGCRKLGIRSLAVMPIRHAHHTIALLMLGSAIPNGIAGGVVELMQPLLRSATAKLAQAMTVETAAAQLALLQDVTNSSRQVLLAEDPGRCLVDAIARIAHAQHVYLLLPEAPGMLVVSESYGHQLDGTATPTDLTTLGGAAFVTGKPKVVADWTSHPGAMAHVVEAIVHHEGGAARSAAYIPLVTAEGTVGVVAALMKDPITAGNAELLGLLELLAAEAGIVISRDLLRRKLADQARTDPLTGLANRRVWNERIQLEQERSSRSGGALAMAMLDLDFFKRYNDSFGHVAGDELLEQVAAAWRDTLRPADLLARLGGEEFGLLLPDSDLATAVAIAERLAAVVPCDQTVSIGLTLVTPDEPADTAMSRADAALYDAKTAGRDRVTTR